MIKCSALIQLQSLSSKKKQWHIYSYKSRPMWGGNCMFAVYSKYCKPSLLPHLWGSRTYPCKHCHHLTSRKEYHHLLSFCYLNLFLLCVLGRCGMFSNPWYSSHTLDLVAVLRPELQTFTIATNGKLYGDCQSSFIGPPRLLKVNP